MGMTQNNSIDMSVASTRHLVADYVYNTLQKHNFVWNSAPPLGNTTNVQIALRKLGDEFERRYRREFADMVEQLNISADLAYPTFNAVAQELFIDGINWGRIVALIAFGGAIAVECFRRHLEHLVDSIHEWVSTYIQGHLETWITSQGGWVRNSS